MTEERQTTSTFPELVFLSTTSGEHKPTDSGVKVTRFTPALFGARFRQSVGTLSPHGKGGTLALSQVAAQGEAAVGHGGDQPATSD